MSEILLQACIPPEFLQQIGEVVQQHVEEAFRKVKTEELEEKFLSPSKVRQMFVPAISRQTLHQWTEKGYLQKHLLGRSVFYKYSEVIAAIQNIKRFERSV